MWEERGGGAVGWLGQLWLPQAWPPHQGWKAWWDGGPCSSGASCSAPWVWQAESLGAPLPAGKKAEGCQGQYLSPCGAIFNSVMTTSPGHLLAIRSRSDSTLCRADCMWMHARFLWMQVMIFGTWRGDR